VRRHHLVSLLAIAAAAFATAPLTAHAQGTKPSAEWADKTIPIEIFGQFPTMDGPRLSPGGNKVAAKVRASGTQALAIIPLGDPKAKPYVIARDDDFSKDSVGDRQITGYYWLDDDNLLISLRSRDNQEGQWFDVTRIAAYNIPSRKITPLGWDGAAGQAGRVLWRSVPGAGKPHLLLERQSNNYGTEKWFNPEVIDVDVQSGKYTIVQRPNPIVRSWDVDGGGTVRIGAARDADTGKLRILYRPDGNAQFKTIVNDAPGMHDDIEMPDEILAGSNKAYSLNNHEGYRALYEYDLDKMAVGKKLFDVPGYDVGSIALTPDGTALQSVSYTDQRDRTIFYEPRLKTIKGMLDQQFGAGNVAITSADLKRTKILFAVSQLAQAPTYYIFDTETGNLSLLSWSNDKLKNAVLNPVETVRYQASDGKSIEAIVTHPRHRAGQKNLPMIIMPHGGPWARDDADWDAYQWAQALAEYGYVVVQPNYRGSTGYGKEFGKAVDGGWGLRMQDDLNDAITWFAKDGTIDPKRVCMVGWSYGGYAASRAAQRDGDKYRCTVSGAGVHDLPAMVGYDKDYLGAYGAKMGIGAAGDLKAISPSLHASEFSTPILIVHGAKDQRVPVAQSRTLVSRLKAAGKKEGKDFIYVEQPLNTHNLLREEDRVQFLQEVKKFLDAHNPA
jgi:dipeptidyl aminopeptidase/acylaminoacyl peptidase